MDDVINVTSFEEFKKRMQEVDKLSVAPCGECNDKETCTIVSICPDYKKYRKKKMNEYGINN